MDIGGIAIFSVFLVAILLILTGLPIAFVLGFTGGKERKCAVRVGQGVYLRC